MIAGIDFSSRAIHLVLLSDDDDSARAYNVELVGATPFERARSARSFFPPRSWFEDEGVYLLGIEDPHSRANHTAKALGFVAGAIAVLLPRELAVVQTPPSEWKRLFTGSASSSKDAVALRARATWPDPPEDADQNTWDAYGIAYAVRHLNNKALQSAETERSVA